MKVAREFERISSFSIIINSTKHRLNERHDQEWPLSDHNVRKWCTKMHWNREDRSGTAMNEERERERGGLERAQIV